jgi:hypothetical protein
MSKVHFLVEPDKFFGTSRMTKRKEKKTLTLFQGFLSVLFQPLDRNSFQSDSGSRIVLQDIPHVLLNSQ